MENGTYVTRAELKATVEPMQSDITEIKGDVKELLAAYAGSRALKGFFSHFSTIGTTLAAGSMGALLTIFFR